MPEINQGPIKELLLKGDSILVKRLKSTGWRAGGLIAIALISLLVDPEIVKVFGLPQIVVLGAGLILNELTKYFNSKQ